MWCCLKKDNVDSFLQEHDILRDNFEKYVLLQIKDAYFLPRWFLTNYKSKYLIEYHGNQEYSTESIEFKFKGKAKDIQEKVKEKIFEIYKNNGYVNGIIKLPPGTGKTVLTIYIASLLGFKTCIVLNNESLLKQWAKSILDFTNLTADDIGIIKQKLFVTDNKPITIAMTGTLISNLKKSPGSYIREFNQKTRFGLVVYDEVHSTSATENFSKCSLLFKTKNIIGLSATPFHFDYQKILMENTIGNIIYESNNYELVPEYNFVIYKSGLNNKIKNYISKISDYIKIKGIYNKFVVKSETYVSTVIKYIRKCYSLGHNVIVICMTIDQVKTISEHLDLPHRRYYGQETEIDKDNDRIVIATYSYCGAGFDMKRLSALIFACPLSGKKSTIQVIGRILRANNDKLNPVVYDLIDYEVPNIVVPEYNRKIKILKEEFPECKIKEIEERK